MVKKRCAVFLLGVLLMGSGPAWPDPGTKLARGLSNSAFGWFEMINEIGNQSDRHGLLIGVPSGLIRGAALGAVRTLAGVYEVVSFLYPNGRRGYQPVILPESVFKRQ